MAIIRWDPFRELVSMQDRMNRLFEDAVRTRGGEDEMTAGSWVPPVDIYETKDAMVVKAQLPEVNKEDIEIRLENGVLSIRGERKLQEDLKREQCYRMECQYGAFSRSFSLPRTVDQEKINANYKDGVLTLRIPKREETRPRQIEIS